MTFGTQVPIGHLLLGAVDLALAVGTVHGQTSPANQLAEALRRGGHLLVMRHASSPREVPNRATANADNSA